jgi:hypothetical protein
MGRAECRRAGVLKPGRYPVELVKKVVEMVRSGRSYGAAARAFKIPRHTVRRWCLREGVRSQFARCGGAQLSEVKTVDGVAFRTTPLYDEYVEVSRRMLDPNLPWYEVEALEKRLEELRKLLKRNPRLFMRIVEVVP